MYGIGVYFLALTELATKSIIISCALSLNMISNLLLKWKTNRQMWDRNVFCISDEPGGVAPANIEEI